MKPGESRLETLLLWSPDNATTFKSISTKKFKKRFLFMRLHELQVQLTGH